MLSPPPISQTRTRLVLTRIPDSWAWVRTDVVIRLIPFTAAYALAYGVSGRAGWLGLQLGDLRVQLVFALAGVAARRLARPHRGDVRLPRPGPLPPAEARSALDLTAADREIDEAGEKHDEEQPPGDVSESGGRRDENESLRTPGRVR